jgi:1-deoxy-D-xylulose-5-phosphate reductoisomerase
MADLRRRIAVLGSTGSIGRQTLDVVRAYPDRFEVVALAARSNVDLLAKQVHEFQPRLVACTSDDAHVTARVAQRIPGALRGADGLTAAATHPDVDVVVAATSGLVGVNPVLAAIERGKTIALANKETLVMAGHLVIPAAREAGVPVYPVDSEHSAIWQCLHGEPPSAIRRLLLTASGGPFRRASAEEMERVTVEQALAHPTWNMGPKVTIDSATLMNKGLEVIEAHWLFGVPYDQIEVVVHPQSIIHSMVEFVDDSIKMQASLPSMHLPIQEALSYPERWDRAGTALAHPLRWPEVARLDFEAADTARFPCLRLAFEAGSRGGTAPAALVGADEEAVALFLGGTITFTDIPRLIEGVLSAHTIVENPDLHTVLRTSEWARDEVRRLAGANERMTTKRETARTGPGE